MAKHGNISCVAATLMRNITSAANITSVREGTTAASDNQISLVEYLSPLLAIFLVIVLALIVLYFCVICPWTTDYTHRGPIMSSWRGSKRYHQSYASTMKQRYIGRRISNANIKPDNNRTRYYQRTNMSLPQILVNSASAPNITMLDYRNSSPGCTQKAWTESRRNDSSYLWTRTLRSLSSGINGSFGSLASTRQSSYTESPKSIPEKNEKGIYYLDSTNSSLKSNRSERHDTPIPLITVSCVSAAKVNNTFNGKEGRTVIDTTSDNMLNMDCEITECDKAEKNIQLEESTCTPKCSVTEHEASTGIAGELKRDESGVGISKSNDNLANVSSSQVWLEQKETTPKQDTAALCEIVGPSLVQHLSVV